MKKGDWLGGRQRGSALLLSLWALLVLSVAVFGLAKFIDQEIGMMKEANLGLDAKALAHSGLQVALCQGVTPRTPALVADFGQNRGYRVRMVSEEGKLNLRYLLEGERPERLAYLKAVLAYRGMKFDQIQRLVDCMLDWVDPDNLKHLNGAEAEGDYQPANRFFQTLDEIAEVKGSEPLVSMPHWKDDFTLYGNGPVDLQSASLAVLSCLPGVGEARARLLIQVRQGPDRLDGTMDDHSFKNLQEALSYLGFSQVPPQFPVALQVSDPNNSIFQILSVGSSGKVDRQVEVIARKLGANSSILLWKEN